MPLFEVVIEQTSFLVYNIWAERAEEAIRVAAETTDPPLMIEDGDYLDGSATPIDTAGDYLGDTVHLSREEYVHEPD